MKEGKIDRRTQYTKRALKESLLSLLERMPAEKITVKEVCELADVNRSTFYIHYETMGNLLEEVELEMGNELQEAISSLWVGEDYFCGVLDRLLDYFKKSPAICNLLLGHQSTGKGLEMVLRSSQEQAVAHYLESGTINRQQAEWIYTYLKYGVKEVVYQWYLTGFQGSQAKLRDTLVGIVERGMYGLVYQPAPPNGGKSL